MTVGLPDLPPPISVRIQGGSGAPLRARRSVLSRLGGHLGPRGAANVALIVSELVTNSVIHAHVGPAQTVIVECSELLDRLRITVTDPGSGQDPHLRSPDRAGAGGYGLAVVQALSSSWGVVRDAAGATSVWCELPLDSPPL